MLDGAAGLWCTNAGHNREPIVAAIQAQAAEMDFAPPFQYANPKSFELASRIAALAPGDLDHVFFCNSGSEAVDTAMKIALAYWSGARAGAAPALHRARARLSRRRLRRHVGRRHRQQPQGVRRHARRASIICRTPIIASSRPSPRASRNGARIWRMNWSGWSRCMATPRSPRCSSSRWRDRPRCCRRRRAICSGCARSATNTKSCWCSTRSSPASAGSAMPSPRNAMAWSRT